MKTSELEERPEVLSASKNQHGTTIVCRSHSDAVAIEDEFGGEIERDRHWTVRVPSDKKKDD